MKLNTVAAVRGSSTLAPGPQGIGAAHHCWDSLKGPLDAIYAPVGFDEDGMWLTAFEEHLLVAGQTGSGKTYSVLANTIMLSAKAASRPTLVVIDSKSTSFDLAASLLGSLGYTVRHVDLRSEFDSDAFNPLLPAWKAFLRGKEAKADIMLDAVLSSLGSAVRSQKDPFWETSAANLIRGLIYALLEADGGKHEPTLQSVSRIIAAGSDAILQVAQSMQNAKGRLLLSGIAAAMGSKETSGGILAEAQAMLGFYDSKLGGAVAGSGGMDIEEEMGGARPTAIFLTSPDEAGDAAKGFASLFFDSVYLTHTYNYEHDRSAVNPGGVRVIFDEWPSFPKCKMKEMLSTARSRNLFVMAGVQSTSQLVASGYSYAESESMLTQFGSCFFFRNADALLGKTASLRTGGLIESKNMIGLNPGEAFVLLGGRTACRLQLPCYDALVDKGAFGSRAAGRIESRDDVSAIAPNALPSGHEERESLEAYLADEAKAGRAERSKRS